MNYLRKQHNSNIVIKTIQKLIAALLFTIILISCSKDEGPNDSNPFIKVGEALVVIPNINNCTINDKTGSSFDTTIPYTSASVQAIDKVTISVTWSDGGTDIGVIQASNFQDDGNTIKFGQCIRYSDLNWIEFEFQLESKDGTISNSTTLKVNKPNGAN